MAKASKDKGVVRRMNLNDIMMLGIFLLIGWLFLNLMWNSQIITSRAILGNITDFEVSAGGFLQRDMCKIQINNTIEIVASGFVCQNLQTGKLLEKINYKNGEIYYRVIE